MMPSLQLSDFIHDAAPLPGMAWAPIRLLSTVHWYWRWSYKKQLYGDPSNWLPIGAGVALNVVGGDGWLRTAAHVVLVVHRTKRYIDQVQLLIKEVDELADAIDGTYSSYPTIPLKQCSQSTWIGAATRRRWHVRAKRLQERLERIALATARVVKALFLVAMYAVEIYDAFYRRREAFNEVFVNGEECVTGIIQSAQKMQAYCEQNPQVMEVLCRHWPALRVLYEKARGPLKKVIEVADQLPVMSQRQKQNHKRGAAMVMMLIMPPSLIPRDFKRELFGDRTNQT